MKDTIHKATSATLEVTKPRKRYINQDTWLSNDDVEMKVSETKCLYHKFLDDKTLSTWQIYKNANPEAKKAIAITPVDRFKNLYDKLNTRNGERDLYRLSKSRKERTQDIERFGCVNDKNGTFLANCQLIDDENTSSRFQLKNLFVLHFHIHCRHLEQFHLSAQLKARRQ